MQIVAFRATPERRQKLLLLANGEGTTVTDILNRLVDNAPVETVTRTGFVLKQKNNSRAQVLTGQSATAVGA